MIDFGTGNGDGVCFVIETKTEQDAERVKDALRLSQLDVFKKREVEPKKEPYPWYESGFIIYNDHVAIHCDIEEFRSSSTPIMSADTFMKFKIAKRDSEYPITITLETR